MADSEHNVKINVNADAHWAVNAFNRVKSTLLSVKASVSQLMSALGMFGMAMQGINALIDAYKWLKGKIGETAREAAKLSKELADASLARRIEREAEKYEKLNKALARTIQLEKERRDILEGRRKAEQSLDEADAELRKQSDIAALDPNAKDYADKKAEIERKYALAALDRKDKAAADDNRAQSETLRKQAGDKDKEQKLKQREADSKYATYEQASAAYFSRWNRQIFNGTDDPEEKKQMAEDKKKIEEIRKAWEKVNDEAKKLGHEADVLRQKAAELVGGSMKEKIRNDAERTKIENERREKAAEKDAKEKKEAEAAKNKIDDAVLKRQEQEALAKLDPRSATYERDRKEIERSYSVKAAEAKVARAENDADRKAAQEELAALNLQNGTESRRELAEAEKAKNEKLTGLLEPFADRAAAADGVSQNRLTAMGLGSGVSASGGVASDVRKLVDLLKQEVEATKRIKVGEASGVAVFGE